MKLALVLLNFFYVLYAWSDCEFNITNYSNTKVKVEAGFYKGQKSTDTVGIASSRVIMVKSPLKCDAISDVGLGITYVNLVSGKSNGGWVYVPSAKLIRATGPSRLSRDSAFGIAPNGEKLVLSNNGKPDSDTFKVSIEKAGRNISRQLGSMD